MDRSVQKTLLGFRLTKVLTSIHAVLTIKYGFSPRIILWQFFNIEFCNKIIYANNTWSEWCNR